MSLEDLVDELLEFGIELELAQRIAPALLPFAQRGDWRALERELAQRERPH